MDQIVTEEADMTVEVSRAIPASFTGNVVVRTVDGQRVVASVDRTDAQGRVDGKIDYTFAMQSERPDLLNIEAEFNNALIGFSGSDLLITPSGQKEGLHMAVVGRSVMGLLQSGARVDNLTDEQREAFEGAFTKRSYKTLTGYGLGYSMVSSEAIPLESTRSADAYVVSMQNCNLGSPLVITALGKNQAIRSVCGSLIGCTAGGPGATSCSITMFDGRPCGTSCGTGYHACCNGLGCNCCKDDEEVIDPP